MRRITTMKLNFQQAQGLFAAGAGRGPLVAALVTGLALVFGLMATSAAAAGVDVSGVTASVVSTADTAASEALPAQPVATPSAPAPSSTPSPSPVVDATPPPSVPPPAPVQRITSKVTTAAKTPTTIAAVSDTVEEVHAATTRTAAGSPGSTVEASIDRVTRTVVDVVPAEAKKGLAKAAGIATAAVPPLKGIAPAAIPTPKISTPNGATAASIRVGPALPAAGTPVLYPDALVPGLTPAFPAPLPGVGTLMAPPAVVAGMTIAAPLGNGGAGSVLSAFAQHRAAGFFAQLEASPGPEVVAASAGTGSRAPGEDGREPSLPPTPLSAPGPTTAPGGLGGSDFIPLVGLMALVALSAPTFRRRSGVTSAFWPPTPFLCAFERPG